MSLLLVGTKRLALQELYVYLIVAEMYDASPRVELAQWSSVSNSQCIILPSKK
jgi:hypothetical protein